MKWIHVSPAVAGLPSGGITGGVGWPAGGGDKPLGVIGLIRPLNCFIAAIGVFVGYSVASAGISFPPELMLGMFSAFLITAAGNLVNDYFDMEIDRRQWKKSPLLSGQVMPRDILVAAIILFAVGIGQALFINTAALTIAIVVSALLVVYSAIMLEHKYIGNFVVALGTAMTILYGAAIVGNYTWALIFAFSAFLANIAREITKDIEDIPIDKGVKRTLPMLLDFEWVKRLVFFLYATAITVAGTAWTSGIVRGWLFIVLLLASTLVFFVAWEQFSEKKFRESQAYSKYGMIVALFAFISVVL